MKKRWNCGILVLSLLMLLCGCTKRFSIVNPVKVTIQKGLDLVEVTDSGTVAALTRQITDMEFRRGESSRDMTGWEYWLKWYDQDGNVLFDCMVAPKSINYDGWFWYCQNGTIDTGEYDRLLGGA